MESIKQKFFDVRAQWTLALLLLAIFVFPAALFVSRALLNFDLSALSPLFLKLLTRSVLFTLGQSVLSAGLCVLLAWPLALLFLSVDTHQRRWRRLLGYCEAVGNFVFAMPSLLMALFIFQAANFLPFLPRSGFWAIILAHLLLNILFVSLALRKRVGAWLRGEGLAIIEAAATLGQSRRRLYWQFLPRLFSSDLWAWFFYVAFLCLGAFSTVLVLGGSPAYSSTEVLLFYSLKNDGEGSRIFLLALAQFGLMGASIVAYRRVFRYLKIERSEAPSGAPGVVSTLVPRNLHGYFLGLVGIGSAFALFLFYQLFWGAFRRFDPQFLLPLQGTLIFVGLSVVLTVGLFILVFFLGSAWRGRGIYLWTLSSTLVMAFWLGAGWDGLFAFSLTARLLLVALCFSLLRLPWICQWIEERFVRFPQDQLEAAWLLGAMPPQILRRLVWPSTRDLLLRAAALSALLAVGEIALISVFVPELPVLSVFVQRQMQRYDFDALAPWVLTLFLLAGIFYALERRLRRI